MHKVIVQISFVSRYYFSCRTLCMAYIKRGLELQLLKASVRKLYINKIRCCVLGFRTYITL